jgi:hypothetical protein
MPVIKNLEDNIIVSLLMPLGDPNDSQCPKGAAALYWGPPGIGKSAILRAAARKCLLPLEVLYAGTKQPEDFSSVLVPDGKGGANSICGLAPIRRLVTAKEGVLFLDEVSCAPPAVQGALLSLELERNVGDTQLPPGVRILAAANPADQAAGGWDLEPPQANRFFHFECKPPTVGDWIKWYTQEGDSSMIEKDALWEKLVSKWGSVYPKIKGQVAGFMQARGKEFLHNLPAEGDPARTRSWPSPRTWWMAGRAAATCLALDKPDQLADFVEGAVGKGATDEFIEWVRKADLPDPKDMLKNGWTPSRQRADIAVAAYTSMTSYIVEMRTIEEKRSVAIAAWNVLDVACRSGLTDIAMASAQKLAEEGLADEEVDDKTLQAARPVIRHLTKSPISRLGNGAATGATP